MKDNVQRQLGDLSLADLEAIDAICQKFEQEWQRGCPARFEDHLANIDNDHVSHLVYELILIEVEHRLRSGEEVVAEDLKKRAPGFESVIEFAFREIDQSIRVDQSIEDTLGLGNSAMRYASLFRLARTGLSQQKRSPGDFLGKFQLVEEVGSGGFGTVWKAVDSELNRVVAIKFPHARAGDPEFERFEREGRSLAKLSHANIVRILSVERDGEVAFIVTDFIIGVSLAKALDGPSLDYASSADLCATIADALQFAHDAGIIHRDVKPGNILLDLHGNPYLTDFGLSRDVDVDTGLTETGNIFGTPTYMSPEQARGDGSRADARSDIYSLGVILFQLLTGDVPFRGSYQVLLNSILHDEPKNPRDLDRKIPRDLDTICRKCLEKEPARRYANAALLAKDLRSWLEGRPISSRPISRAERGIRWSKRQPVVASLLASILILSVSAFSTVTWLWRSAVAANHDRRMAQVNALLTAEPSSVSVLLQQISSEADAAVISWLRRHADDVSLAPTKRLRTQEALLNYDIGRLGVIVESLLEAPVEEIPHVIESLKAVASISHPVIRERLLVSSQKPSALLPLAAAYLRIMPSDPVLSEYAAPIAKAICEVEPASVVQWSKLFAPMASELRSPLFENLATAGANLSFEAIQAIATLYENSSKDLLNLLPKAGTDYFRMITGLLGDHRNEALELASSYVVDAEKKNREGTISFEEARSAAMHCLAAFSMDPEHASMRLLNPGKSGAARHHLIVLPARLGIDPSGFLRRLEKASDSLEASGYLLTLGQFVNVPTAQQWKEDIVGLATNRFINDPDPGVHSAAEWLLRQWDGEDSAKTLSESVQSFAPLANRRWYIHPEGLTFLICEIPSQHTEMPPYQFAISSTEVTSNQIIRWNPKHNAVRSANGTLNNAAGFIDAISARDYCTWLSMQEMQVNEQSATSHVVSTRLKTSSNYRLPLNSEWEYATRLGTIGPNFIGGNEVGLLNYAWLAENSIARLQPPGRLMPNPFGLFDVIGNVSEWVEPNPLEFRLIEAIGSIFKQTDSRAITRGQIISTSFHQQSISAFNSRMLSDTSSSTGFRVSRSISP